MALFVFASLVKSLVLVFAAVTTVASFGSSERQSRSFRYVVCNCTLADSGFFKNYQGGVKSTVSWVFEDLWFKISEGSDPNWCFLDSAQLAVLV